MLDLNTGDVSPEVTDAIDTIVDRMRYKMLHESGIKKNRNQYTKGNDYHYTLKYQSSHRSCQTVREVYEVLVRCTKLAKVSIASNVLTVYWNRDIQDNI